MNQPLRSGRFLRGPLFDRLIDKEPSQSVLGASPKTLNRNELKESVRIELNNILNSRSSFPQDDQFLDSKSVVNFGMPDFSKFDPTNQKSRDQLKEMVEKTIAQWEPRLKNISVDIDEIALEDKEFAPFRLNLIIEATLIEEVQREPVTFHLAFDEGAREKIEQKRTYLNETASS